jgi:hypothetical protein
MWAMRPRLCEPPQTEQGFRRLPDMDATRHFLVAAIAFGLLAIGIADTQVSLLGQVLAFLGTLLIAILVLCAFGEEREQTGGRHAAHDDDLWAHH